VSGATSGGTGRAYRRMPDDFAAVYQHAGSASAVAAHYQVPRHTGNGWIRRLRKQGIIPTGR
jgi:transposase